MYMSQDTKQKIIEISIPLLRSKGYANFSYSDLEKVIQIRKASIHYHFPSKEDLGREIIEQSIQQTQAHLQQIEDLHDHVIARLKTFAEVFIQSQQEQLLPLCGALAAQMSVLPETLQALTRQYFQLQLHWLEKILLTGMQQQHIASGNAAHQARLFFSFLEGISLVTWATSDLEYAAHIQQGVDDLCRSFQA